MFCARETSSNGLGVGEKNLVSNKILISSRQTTTNQYNHADPLHKSKANTPTPQYSGSTQLGKPLRPLGYYVQDHANPGEDGQTGTKLVFVPIYELEIVKL